MAFNADCHRTNINKKMEKLSLFMPYEYGLKIMVLIKEKNQYIIGKTYEKARK